MLITDMNRDVDDVARTHVKSLQLSAVPGNKRYLLVGDITSAAKLANKLRAEYPTLKPRVPSAVEEGSGPAKFDTSRADRVFGTNWVSGWDSAVATVKDILAYEAAHPNEL